MAKVLTYLDTCVLGWALRSNDPGRLARAMAILNDPSREYACSNFVMLECMPPTLHHKNAIEEAFYNAYFNRAVAWPKDDLGVLYQGFREGVLCGAGGIDAVHIAAAVAAGASELITAEKDGKPITRTKSIKVTSIA